MTSTDPYTQKATQKSSKTPQQKIDGLHKIIKATQTSMMTTRGVDGNLHSRAMAPASYESLHFNFIANNTSDKFTELEQDPHVNVSFYDPSTTNWISIAGSAKLSSFRSEVKKYWNPGVRAWFGDLGDGVHKGDENDPRVSVIEVIPEDIVYWEVTRGAVGRGVEILSSAISGDVASPGALITISKEEISLIERMNVQK